MLGLYYGLKNARLFCTGIILVNLPALYFQSTIIATSTVQDFVPNELCPYCRGLISQMIRSAE